MDLKTYLVERDGRLFKEGVELQRIAKDASVSPYYLFMVAAGHKKAGAKLARAVAESTNHAVTPGDLREDYFGAPPALGGKRRAA